MIDAHHHFWKYDSVRHGWISAEMKAIRRDFQPEDLKPIMIRHDASCVTVQVDQTEEETLQLVALANKHEFVAGVVGWIDLRNENLRSRLDYFSSLKKLKGFRHIVQGEPPGFLAQPSFIRGVNDLSGYGLTYDLLIYHHQLPEAVAFAKQVKDTMIVVDHIAKPAIAQGEITGWEKHMRELAQLPNVYCKVSGMVTENTWNDWAYEDFVPYLDVVTDAFTPGRLLYGSDWPVCLLAATYDEQLSLVKRYIEQLSPSEKKQVLGENAKRFYNL